MWLSILFLLAPPSQAQTPRFDYCEASVREDGKQFVLGNVDFSYGDGHDLSRLKKLAPAQRKVSKTSKTVIYKFDPSRKESLWVHCSYHDCGDSACMLKGSTFMFAHNPPQQITGKRPSRCELNLDLEERGQSVICDFAEKAHPSATKDDSIFGSAKGKVFGP